jgi:hypothetical protein
MATSDLSPLCDQDRTRGDPKRRACDAAQLHSYDGGTASHRHSAARTVDPRVRLSWAEERKDYSDDNHEAHEIDDSIHDAFLCYWDRNNQTGKLTPGSKTPECHLGTGARQSLPRLPR